MGANYSFYVKIIETHARAFFKVIIFSIGSVGHHVPISSDGPALKRAAAKAKGDAPRLDATPNRS